MIPNRKVSLFWGLHKVVKVVIYDVFLSQQSYPGLKLKEPMLTYEKLVEIHYECGLDQPGDRAFVTRLMRELFTMETLLNCSVSGKPSNMHRDRMAKQKFDPAVIHFIYERFCERVAALSMSPFLEQERTKKSVFNRYIACTCNLAMKNHILRMKKNI